MSSENDSQVQDQRPADPARAVDELEERVVGHRVDQDRDEDDDPRAPAFEQDLDSEDTSRADPDAPV